MSNEEKNLHFKVKLLANKRTVNKILWQERGDNDNGIIREAMKKQSQGE